MLALLTQRMGTGSTADPRATVLVFKQRAIRVAHGRVDRLRRVECRVENSRFLSYLACLGALTVCGQYLGAQAATIAVQAILAPQVSFGLHAGGRAYSYEQSCS